MKIDSHYSKSFYSDDMTRYKYDELYNLAVNIRDTKNELSAILNENLTFYLDGSKFTFQTQMLPVLKERVNSNFSKKLCDDVFIAYDNRLEQVKRRIVFPGNITIESLYYKIDKGKKKKGEFKSAKKTCSQTSLSKVLSYLSRYGNHGTLSYINSKFLEETNPEKIKFYKNIIDICGKFGFQRLLNLALMRRENILRRYSKPVVFKSLNFRGRSRLTKDIVRLNENKHSKIKAFIEISWLKKGESIFIPVGHSYAWHGKESELSKYTNGTETSYIICFDERKKQVRIILTHEGEREYHDVDMETDKIIGFDVNSKHSQIIGSRLNIEVDHDREALDRLIVELKKIDDLKSKDKDYVIGKRRAYKIEAIRRQIKETTKRNCSKICKQMILEGYNHAVFENLNKSFGKTYAKTSDDFNYNRFISEMNLCSIKDEFEHIARNGRHDIKKTKIAVSFVHAEYTSQQCSFCFYIHEDNRLTQEDFKCLECGHEENADSNAARNIERRVSEAVQRDLLDAQKKLGGSFRPKTLHRKQVLTKLLTYRDAWLKNQEQNLMEPKI